VADRIRRGTSFAVRGRGARRQTLWLGGSLTTTTVATGTSVLVTVLNAAALLLRPFTVIRSRGLLMWESDQSAAGERPVGAVGEIVVTDVATGVGVAAVPTPVTDDESDWFWYQTLMMTLLVAPTGTGPGQIQYAVDSKAMRKVDTGDDVAMVVQNSSGVGAILTSYIKLLVKLH